MYNKITDGGRTFSVTTVKDWNQLPTSMKKIKSVKHLRKTLYEKLLKEKKQPSFFKIRDSLLCSYMYLITKVRERER